MPDPLPHISVCICTRRRAEQLACLLKKLDGQETGGLFEFSVVVADNDAERSAEPVVRAGALRVPVRYCVQPQPNIALTRNAALAQAKGDYIAFIDDDEFPVPCWLLELFKTLRRYQSDGVLGPVVPRFQTPPPRWIARGRFFDRPTHPTGFRIGGSEGRTGNLLFRREIIEGMDPVFRPRFGGGGEDRDLFRRWMAMRREFVWCNQAVAYEWVPPGRMKRRFMLRRALLRGKMSLEHRRGALDLVKSAAAVGLYGLLLPVAWPWHHLWMKLLVKACDHAGKLLAFAGIDPVKETYLSQ